MKNPVIAGLGGYNLAADSDYTNALAVVGLHQVLNMLGTSCLSHFHSMRLNGELQVSHKTFLYTSSPTRHYQEK